MTRTEHEELTLPHSATVDVLLLVLLLGLMRNSQRVLRSGPRTIKLHLHERSGTLQVAANQLMTRWHCSTNWISWCNHSFSVMTETNARLNGFMNTADAAIKHSRSGNGEIERERRTGDNNITINTTREIKCLVWMERREVREDGWREQPGVHRFLSGSSCPACTTR